MACFISVGEFQKHLYNNFLHCNQYMSFKKMANYLYKQGLLADIMPEIPPSHEYRNLTDSDFEDYIDRCPLVLYPLKINSENTEIIENDIFPSSKDVFVFRHLRFSNEQMHSHDYFEMHYILSGSCKLFFENTSRVLNESEFCILSPHSSHDLVIDNKDTTVITILIRKSTFSSTFFTFLSQKDLLSYFFRTILYDDSRPNYLLFITKHSDGLKNLIKNLAIESYRNDLNSNETCISWTNLIFSELLRNWSDSIQFHDYNFGSDVSMVLQYIQRNYQHCTLKSLKEQFHYSESHLSNLINRNTGYRFTELVKVLRMADAEDYLKNTSLKISEIAEITGYHSPDHFSRVFRSCYHISPQEYRKKNKQN